MVQMTLEAGGLREFLDGRWGRIREEVRAQIQETPLLRPVHGLPTEEYRARVLEQARLVSQTRSAARDGRMAAVFAQLVTGGQGRGVHVFLVPIRDERGRACPGVRIEDCGEKGGLNGVDNGRLWFDQVRVPREALLDRFGAVAPDGSYTSPIANDTRRFFTMLGTLVSGRVSVAGAGLSAAKLALTIAIRYGLTRRQFRAPGSDREVTLLDYLQHQRRLLPALATTYALHFAQEALVTALHDAGDGDSADEAEQRRLETLAAGLKAVSTWHTTQTIQTC